jgi:hypothetical protein
VNQEVKLEEQESNTLELYWVKSKKLKEDTETS